MVSITHPCRRQRSERQYLVELVLERQVRLLCNMLAEGRAVKPVSYPVAVSWKW